jgi:undecaprenyl pyrophosphate phosphatase UppP
VVIQLGSIVAVVSYFLKDPSNISTWHTDVRHQQYKLQEFKLVSKWIVRHDPTLFGGLLIKNFVRAMTSRL